jgi:DNA repair ATPase RecN
MEKISNINKALRDNFKDAKKALSNNLDAINNLPAKEVDASIKGCKNQVENMLYDIDNILKALGKVDGKDDNKKR